MATPSRCSTQAAVRSRAISRAQASAPWVASCRSRGPLPSVPLLVRQALGGCATLLTVANRPIVIQPIVIQPIVIQPISHRLQGSAHQFLAGCRLACFCPQGHRCPQLAPFFSLGRGTWRMLGVSRVLKSARRVLKIGLHAQEAPLLTYMRCDRMGSRQ
jgi:hypothetical protein